MGDTGNARENQKFPLISIYHFKGQMLRNMSMNSLAKYLANSAQIDGLRSALKSGWIN